jgi:hypothetical protein
MRFEPWRNVGYPCCLGHAGMPVTTHPVTAPVPKPGAWEWRGQYESGGDAWLIFGFAVLDFNGPTIDVTYVDQYGNVGTREQIPLPPSP